MNIVDAAKLVKASDGTKTAYIIWPDAVPSRVLSEALYMDIGDDTIVAFYRYGADGIKWWLDVTYEAMTADQWEVEVL